MPVAASKALAKAAESGDPLPLPGALSEVERRGGRMRRGHLSMIAGISNSGKSAFAEWLAAETNVPTLYFSADQDAWTSITRLGGILTGQTINAVAAAIAEDGPAAEYYNDQLDESSLHFVFDSNPSLADIAAELDAYVDTWDEWPELIVIDNLVNIEASGEHQDDMFIMSELHGLARRTGAHVCVLAHMKEGGIKDPKMPPPKKDLYNQTQRYPDLIFSIALDSETGDFRVAIVKTREGKADPQANNSVVLGSDFTRCQFFGSPRRTSSWGAWDGGDQ